MTSIIVGLILLMALAYLGWSIIWIAPIVAGLVALMSGLDLLLSLYGNIYDGIRASPKNGSLYSFLEPSSES